MSLPPTTTVLRTAARRERSRSRRPLLWALQVGVPVVLLLAWWFFSLASTNRYFPPLKDILGRFQELWLFERFASDVLPSVGNFALGYLIACAVGVTLGVLLGLVRPLFWILDPVVQLVRSIPAVALVPIFVTTLGFGNEVRVFAIALTATFPVLISTIDGVRAVDPLLIETARVYRLPFIDRLRRIYLPAASPQMFAGGVVSLQVAFIVMITSEMLGATHGLGFLTMFAQQQQDVRSVWAGIVLLGILGYLANVVFVLVRKRALAWYLGAQKAASAD